MNLKEDGPEARVVRDFYAAINRNDIPAAIESFDEDFEWMEPSDTPGAGTYRGLERVVEHFKWARGTWAEGSCEPEQLLVAGIRILALVAVRVRLKAETEWRVGEVGDVFTFQDGKAIRGRSFWDRREALEFVGVEPVSPEAAR